jgi:hypothetical protein
MSQGDGKERLAAEAAPVGCATKPACAAWGPDFGCYFIFHSVGIAPSQELTYN